MYLYLYPISSLPFCIFSPLRRKFYSLSVLLLAFASRLAERLLDARLFRECEFDERKEESKGTRERKRATDNERISAINVYNRYWSSVQTFGVDGGEVAAVAWARCTSIMG